MDKEAPKGRRPRKLNFNAPLLSTRRPSGSAAGEETSDHANPLGPLRNTSKRVPFSWEQAPGKPKDMGRRETHFEDPPPPKLPPARWPLPKEASDDDYDDYGDDEDDAFSDAIDTFSLSGSLEIADSTASNGHGLVGLNLETIESSCNESPDFIIRRFLPAANALAASSSRAVLKSLNSKVPPLFHSSKELSDRQHRVHQRVPPSVSRSYSPPKACGLAPFFPWRMKYSLCGLKSPIRRASLNVKVGSNVVHGHRHSSSRSAERPSRGGVDCI